MNGAPRADSAAPSPARPGLDRSFLAAAAALLLVFAGWFVTPLWDIDTGWHIASGRWILDHGQLPSTDPFGVYPHATGVRADVILRGYWLAQVLLAAVHDGLGAAATSVLAATLLVLSLGLGLARARLLGAGRIATLVTATVGGLVALDFTGARPQLVSFVLAAALFGALDVPGWRSNTRTLWIVPALVLVWANVHGAVTLGALLLAVYAVGLAIEVKLLERAEPHLTRQWYGIVVAALASAGSPVALETWAYLARWSGSELERRTSEWTSPVAWWRASGPSFGAYWIFLVLTAVGMVGLLRSSRAKEALVTAALAVLSLTALRHAPFLVFVAGPYVALGLSGLLEAARLPAQVDRLAASVGAATAVVVTIGGLASGRTFRTGIDPARFPIAAVRLLEERHATGRVFTHWNWGGYVLARLAPSMRPFVDGRLLDERLLPAYTNILWATPEGLKALTGIGFDYVLVPVHNPGTGEVYPLPRALASDPRWRVILEDGDVRLFEHAR